MGTEFYLEETISTDAIIWAVNDNNFETSILNKSGLGSTCQNVMALDYDNPLNSSGHLTFCSDSLKIVLFLSKTDTE